MPALPSAPSIQILSQGVLHGLQRGIKDIRTVASHGTADGHWLSGLDPPAYHGDRAFRRAVGIFQPAAGSPLCCQILGEGFAANVDETQVRQLSGRIVALVPMSISTE